jgi:ElaB/YqjD/DUF883 family membrane-anchored ribosome-binding protein
MAYETSKSEAGRTDAPTGIGDDTPRASEDWRDTAAAAASEARSTASNLGRKAAKTAEKVRTSTAEGLHSAASSVHAGGERMASAAHRVGDALATGAEYVRRNEVADMADDLMDLVRNHPGPALVCAAALGFLLGRSVYRR